MKTISQIISWLALAGVVLPSVLFYLGSLEQESMKGIMLIATIVWFIFTPVWMEKEKTH